MIYYSLHYLLKIGNIKEIDLVKRPGKPGKPEINPIKTGKDPIRLMEYYKKDQK